jgi:hypothetical protein
MNSTTARPARNAANPMNPVSSAAASDDEHPARSAASADRRWFQPAAADQQIEGKQSDQRRESALVATVVDNGAPTALCIRLRRSPCRGRVNSKSARREPLGLQFVATDKAGARARRQHASRDGAAKTRHRNRHGQTETEISNDRQQRRCLREP